MTSVETYRASPSAYVVFGVIWGVPALICAAAALFSSLPWSPVVLCTAAYAFTCLWLSRYRLTFLRDRICYHSLFAADRVMAYVDIASVSPIAFRRPFYYPFSLLMTSRTGEELRINIKVFPKEAVHRVVAAGGGRLSSVHR